jgi:Protein of unknown function (DUF2721)
MNDLAGALAILSAMITPAVLILACGSLTLATSQRLGRVIERTRRISNQFKELARNRTDQAMLEESASSFSINSAEQRDARACCNAP